jgi:hypothetical protein
MTTSQSGDALLFEKSVRNLNSSTPRLSEVVGLYDIWMPLEALEYGILTIERVS